MRVETIAADQASVQLVEVAEVSNAEQIYTHTHSDGTEFSGTAIEARKACPVLGQMSLEGAQTVLQQQDLAARIVARGRAKRVAEEQNPEPVREIGSPKTEHPTLPSAISERPQTTVIPEPDELILLASLEQAFSMQTQSVTETQPLIALTEQRPKTETGVSISAEEPKHTAHTADVVPELVSKPPTQVKIEIIRPELEVQPSPVDLGIVEAKQPIAFTVPEQQQKPITIELQKSESQEDSLTEAETAVDLPDTTSNTEPNVEPNLAETPQLIKEVEVDDPTPNQRVIVEIITQDLEPEPVIVEQVGNLAEIMPEEVQETLAEYLVEAEPEVIEAAQNILVELAAAADYLHEIALNDQIDNSDIKQIQEQVVDLYVELLSLLEIEIDEADIKIFIENICSDSYKTVPAQVDQAFHDILHERQKLNRFNIPINLTQISPTILAKLAKLMVQRSLIAA